MGPIPPNHNHSSHESKDTGKGKGKENQPSQSIVARVAASSARLTSQVLSNSGQGRFYIDPSSSEKAGSSSRVHSSTTQEQQQTARVSRFDTSNPTAFRSAQSPSLLGERESEFSSFLDPSETGTGRADLKRQVSEAAAASLSDGSEVVSLLQAAPAPDEWAEPDLSMTDAELACLRRALFDNAGAHGMTQMQWDSALNFMPDFSRHDVEARDVWVSQWQQVLSSYTDEVWGDLGGLVQAAREEVHEVSTRESGQASMSAVRRLQQLLTHIRGV
ncbi:hypothetical protein F5Y16DRAFT_371663 [Xylariaceae sp. FL0255]|nr:hypothetical protein F5Y16DRAFT_371663 [Xylariaceae sp. FL0255]